MVDTPQEHRIRMITDGISLQEYRNNPWLYQHSYMITDEAHEISLNIDLLLGILKIYAKNDLTYISLSPRQL